MNDYKLIIEKSTVPADTGNRVKRTIKMNLPKKFRKDKGVTLDFDVASNPEFLREGSAVSDFMNPDRIVVGVESKKAEKSFRDSIKADFKFAPPHNGLCGVYLRQDRFEEAIKEGRK